MKLWILCVIVLSISLFPVISAQNISGMISELESQRISKSFLVNIDGSQNCIVVVGEKATADTIIEASRLATVIGNISRKDKKIPIIEEVDIIHENIPPHTCIVETPRELETLWYFDDFGVYGNDNGRFDLWETHEEIQLYIEDFLVRDHFNGYTGDGFLDFSAILRIDNIRCPPSIRVTSHFQRPSQEPIVDLDYDIMQYYRIVDPFYIINGYIPRISIFGVEYDVIYIDSRQLITGTPHIDYVYVYKNQPLTIGDYTINVKDVDVDHNKAYLSISGGTRGEFWLVLDPEHGFSPSLQNAGSQGILSYDTDGDGTPEYYSNDEIGRSELDVWGNGHDFLIDGIKTFIGETVGIYLEVYWVEDYKVWSETDCCDPFVKYPDPYYFQIRPENRTLSPSKDSFVDEGSPLQNFGELSSLTVRSLQNFNARSFVQFILPPLPSSAIITKALLQLTPITVPGSRVYEVSRVTGYWDEPTLNWSNQPGALLTGNGVLSANMMVFDVTSDVIDFYSGTQNYGWRISDQTEDSPVVYEAIFGSSESMLKPRLSIEYTYDCNYFQEVIPHIENRIGTYYDDIEDDGIMDPVYEIDIGLCEPVSTLCDPLFFEGPNYYFFIDFWNISFKEGVDFRIYLTDRVNTYTVKETKVTPWELIKLDVEVSEKDAPYNWILIGNTLTNIWIQKLVDNKIVPDDGSSAHWFTETEGYKMYSDPLAIENRILVIGGNTLKEINDALNMLIKDLSSSFL
ncbi:MAG: DNRLRE domain-containing protein [Theionarchaea archaeon]|nr:DNRLRE domain-containing protein [Theionarchaea archaeon]